MKKLAKVNFANNINYELIVGRDCLQQFGSLLDQLEPISRIIIVTDENVDILHAYRLEKLLSEKRYAVSKHVLNSGRKQKSFSSIERILDLLFTSEADRNSIIINLGGGVVGDIGGLVAALYLRGIRYIHMPTTLLSQVDSSIGGKVGINYPEHLNGIGHYYYPQVVWVDLSFLDTLSRAEFNSGLAEIIKYSVILDAPFFEYLEQNVVKIRQRDSSVIEYIVQYCILQKSAVVSADPTEIGDFKLFTYGHEIGHALEVVLDYQGLRHGEAIAIGSEGSAWLSRTLGYLKNIDVLDRQKNLMSELELPIKIPQTVVSMFGGSELLARRILQIIKMDKKRENGQAVWVLPVDIGSGSVTNQLTDDHIYESLSYLMKP